jgi:hypothetical protein
MITAALPGRGHDEITGTPVHSREMVGPSRSRPSAVAAEPGRGDPSRAVSISF